MFKHARAADATLVRATNLSSSDGILIQQLLVEAPSGTGCRVLFIARARVPSLSR